MTHTVTVDAARTYWHTLDLTYLADVMCADSYPLPRWTQSDALRCVQLYKNFLWLNKLHPGTALVPTREIDECWHNHILYTKNYLHDCLHLFGHYLHHDPKKPGDDDAALAQDYLHTKALYLQEFNQPLSLIIDVSTATP